MKEELIALFVKVTGRKQTDIDKSFGFLYMDELDRIEFFMQIEDATGVEIPENSILPTPHLMTY